MKTDGNRSHDPNLSEGGGRRFCTTQWNLVALAGTSPSHAARQALELLCRTYWPPVYAFIRRRGHTPHEAEDLTQGFFEHVLARSDLLGADPNKGRFRTFLVTLLIRYLSHEHERANRLKRGGGVRFVSVEAGDAERHAPLEMTAARTPETEYERRWAETLVARALDMLRQEYEDAGSVDRFEVLEPYLVDLKGTLPFVTAAARLGLTEAATKSAAHRLRHRYQKMIRAEIARTVVSPSEIDDELRHLFLALSN